MSRVLKGCAQSGGGGGGFQKDNVMREFLFSRSTLLVETTSELMAATERVTTNVQDSDVDSSDDDICDDDAREEAKGGR